MQEAIAALRSARSPQQRDAAAIQIRRLCQQGIEALRSAEGCAAAEASLQHLGVGR